MQKNDILKLPVITEEQAKKKFEHNKSNATEVNNKEPEYYYINLYNEKLFAKVPSNKCSYNPRDESFTVETDKQGFFWGHKMSYEVKTGKNLVRNRRNIDGILLEGDYGKLFFNKEDGRFSYYTDVFIDNDVEYQISLEKFLSDDNPSFNLFRSSYWENLFNPSKDECGRNKAGSFARLFGVANDGNNRCGVGCFSCGKVIVDDDYTLKSYFFMPNTNKANLSLDNVSEQIGINQITK